MPPIPDLVRLSKLDVSFSSDPHFTQHVYYVSKAGQRGIRQEERWNRLKELGAGSFGAVYLERCIQGDKKGEVRAVKKIRKREGTNYHRELEALSYFSYPQFERCFVKSFGWYNDADSIFIAMEYLRYGDLHHFLGTPLPEREGQQIVYQIVEGLGFMHENGFAHRDLKPANILVVCKGPNWWVKIADFGISKRAAEGLTALRTLTGTPAFAAPELLGYGQTDPLSDSSYTNAIDMWSTGIIAFLILTGETYFRDQRRLGQYATGRIGFPRDVLLAQSVSELGCDFTKSLMTPEPKDRPSAKESLRHGWLTDVDLSTASKTREENFTEEQRITADDKNERQSPADSKYSTTQNHSVDQSTTKAPPQSTLEPSASWSTPRKDYAHDVSDFQNRNMAQGNAALQVSENAVVLDTRATRCWHAVKRLQSQQSTISSVAFSPDGRIVASGSDGWFQQGCRLQLWDVVTGAEVKWLIWNERVEGPAVSVAFSRDGQLMTSADTSYSLRLWEVATGKEVKRFEAPRPKSGRFVFPPRMAFSPDGRLIAWGLDDSRVRLQDVATGVEVARLKIKRLEGLVEPATCMAFSPDGRLIVTGAFDITARLWEVATGAEIKRFEGDSELQSIAFSPDGRLLAFGMYDHTVRLRDVATGAEIKQLKGHENLVASVAFSPDGRLIASGSYDKTVRLWEVATAAEIKQLKGHENVVASVAFSPDGRLIASGAWDSTVRLWDWEEWEVTAVNTHDGRIGFRKRLKSIFR